MTRTYRIDGEVVELIAEPRIVNVSNSFFTDYIATMYQVDITYEGKRNKKIDNYIALNHLDICYDFCCTTELPNNQYIQ
jgi:hypothetical protein